MVLEAKEEKHIHIPLDNREDDADDIYISINISCSSNIKTEDERLRADYTVTVDENTYRPYGIRCVLLNERETRIGDEKAKCRFATLDEALSIMRMLVRETVLPGTIKDILE